MNIGGTLWVVAHWIAAAAASAVSLLLIALDAFSGDDLSGDGAYASLVGLVSGALAAVLGAILASVVIGRGTGYAQFMSATTTSRTIACGWLLVILAVIFSGIVTHGGGFQHVGQNFGAMLDRGDFSSLVSALGVSSLLAQVGFGLTEFHRSREVSALGKSAE